MIRAGLVSGLTLSLPVLAQPAAGAQDAQALFDSGLAKAKSGNCQDAIPDFEASHKAEPSRGSLYNLAVCEHDTGKLVLAWTHFQELLPQLDQADARMLDAQQRIAALERRIARVRVTLAAGTPAGATVTLDGAEVRAERLGTEIALDPGPHVLVVTAPERRETRHDLTAGPGQQQTLTLEAGAPIAQRGAGPAPSPAPIAPIAPQSGSSLSLAPGLVAGGVGLAGLGVMAVTGILAIGRKGELEEMCPDPTRCNGPGAALAREGQALSTASTAAAVIGLVGAGAGVTLLVWSGRSSKTAKLGPVVWASGAGAMLEGRF